MNEQTFPDLTIITDGTRAVECGPMGDVLSEPFPLPATFGTSWPRIVGPNDRDMAGETVYIVSEREFADYVLATGTITPTQARFYIEFRPRNRYAPIASR